MGATATRLTSAQYYAASVEADWTQLVEGEIVVSEPKPIHALLQVRLTVALQSWVEGEGSGLVLLTTNVEMDRHNVYGPDLMWFSESHRPPDLDEYPERIPDLCVEIRSPGTWRYDIGAKMRVYESAGLPELCRRYCRNSAERSAPRPPGHPAGGRTQSTAGRTRNSSRGTPLAPTSSGSAPPCARKNESSPGSEPLRLPLLTSIAVTADE